MNKNTNRMLAGVLTLILMLGMTAVPAAASESELPESIAIEVDETEDFSAAKLPTPDLELLDAAMAGNITAAVFPATVKWELPAGTDPVLMTFTPGSSGAYTFESAGTLDTELTIYDHRGYEVDLEDQGGTGKNFRTEVILIGGLTYSLACTADNTDADRSFNMTISRRDLKDVLPSIGSSLPEDLIVTAGMGSPAYYLFTPASSGYYDFRSIGSMDTTIAIYDSASEMIASDDDSGASQNFHTRVTLEAGKEYLLQFGTYAQAPGQFDVKISRADGAEDEILVLSASMPVDTEVSISSESDTCYRFTPASDGRYYFRSTGDLDTAITVLSGETEIGSNDDRNAVDANFNLAVDLEGGTTYQIVLSSRSEEAGNIRLSVHRGSTPAAVTRVAPTSGGNRYTTAIATADQMKAELGYDKFDTIVLANAENYPDALAGGPLASMLTAPILLVGKNTSVSLNYIKSNLTEGGRVILLGGTFAVSASIETQLKGQGYQVERLAGSNRYGTNAAIVNKMYSIMQEYHGWTSMPEVVVVQGMGYADSLSVSGVAGAYWIPILLVPQDDVGQEQLDFIRKVDPEEIRIIGGIYAVTEMTENILKHNFGYDLVTRTAGANRFATSIAIAKAYAMDQSAPAAVAAYGMNFPDGLTGGVLAGITKSPVLLVTDSGYAQAAAYVSGSRATKGYVMGGKLVISDATATKVFAGLK